MFGGTAYLWTCTLVAFASSNHVVDAQSTYDVIVVGSGPGGLVAAEHLSLDPSVSVLIIEAGPKSLAATGGTRIPGYAMSQGLTIFDIMGEYENANHIQSDYHVDWFFESSLRLAKLVGGCSSTNAALYFVPPDNYVTTIEWPFSAESMITKMEENAKTHGATDKPSMDGVWYLQEGYSIVAKALLAQGYTEKALNDAAARNNKSKTFGHPTFASKDGRRNSPANVFWGKMSTRSNVKLLTDTKVDYILHSAGKATGVVYGGGTTAQLSSRGTIIMAAGALSTPKVLIQSGIGPADQLNILRGKGNFPGVAQGDWIVSPNVGRNLFDGNAIFASFAHPDMKSFRFRDSPGWAIDQYMANRSGPWTGSGPVLVSYESFEVQGRTYDFQTTVLPHGFLEFAPRNDALMMGLFLNNPESRAACGFDGNGAWRAFNQGSPYLSTNRDMIAMQQYAQRVVSAMTAQGATFLSAGSDAGSVANWVARSTRFFLNHFGGTCYASSDSSASSNRCADNKLRVLRTKNVFIADASAMRDGTVNPYGFIMYIGREAAEQVARYISSGGAGNEWDIQMPSQVAGCSAIEVNVDYSGNDIGSVMSNNVNGCCAICGNTAACKAYTWTSYNGGTCWLKSAKGAVSANSGALSAELIAPRTN